MNFTDQQIHIIKMALSSYVTQLHIDRSQMCDDAKSQGRKVSDDLDYLDTKENIRLARQVHNKLSESV